MCYTGYSTQQILRITFVKIHQTEQLGKRILDFAEDCS